MHRIALPLIFTVYLAGLSDRPLEAQEPICSNPNVPVPDNDPAGVSDILSVADPLTIEDLDVEIQIQHSWVGDVSATLEHLGSGHVITLIDRPGVPALGGFGCSGADIAAVLDDEATSAVEDACEPLPPSIVGQLIPNQPLAILDGENLAGDWVLTVTDSADGDTGQLLSWCLAPSSGTGGETVYAEDFTGGPNSVAILNGVPGPSDPNAGWHVDIFCPGSQAGPHTAPDVLRWGVFGSCSSYGNLAHQDIAQTPGLDLPGGCELGFNYLIDIVDPAFANATVLNNGEVLLDLAAGDLILDQNWHSAAVPLPPGPATIEFLGQTGIDGLNDGQGWLIDDIVVTCSPPAECPLAGEVSGLRLGKNESGDVALTWDPDQLANSYTVYRGNLDEVAQHVGSCLETTIGNSFLDPSGGDTGNSIYVVTTQAPGGEGTLGQASSGAPRASLTFCDTDEDLLPDGLDNCLRGFNPGQSNIDGDCRGDVCDPCEQIPDPCPTVDDTFCSVGEITVRIFDGVLEPGQEEFEETLQLSSAGLGDSIVVRTAPPYTDCGPGCLDPCPEIDTEMEALELEGFSPTLGNVIVRERVDKISDGGICCVDADPFGEFLSGDSYFNIFAEIEVPDLGIFLNTGDNPVRLQAEQITELPPFGTDYIPQPPQSGVCDQPGGPATIPLFVEGIPGVPVGELTHALHRPGCPCEITITDTPPDWLPEGREYGTPVGTPGNSVDYTATVTFSAPRKVRFFLEDVSSEPGVAINYGDESGADPDLKFIQTATVNPPAVFDPPSPDGQTITTKNAVTEVTVTVTSFDWGSWGKIKACCLNAAGECESETPLKDIPVDDLPAGGNHIGDAWQPAHASEAATWDADDFPDDMKRDGDGYTFYEEYRGTMAGFIAVHKRLDPDTKELFIYDEDTLHLNSHASHKFIFLTLIKIEYVNADPAELMNGEGLAADGKRVINHKSEFSKQHDQFALHIKKFNLAGRANWGLTDGSDLGPPETADPLIKIDSDQVADDFSVAVTSQGGDPGGAEQGAFENVRDREIAVTVTHEMGHGCNVLEPSIHHDCGNGGRQSPYGDEFCGEVLCVMRYDFDLVDSRFRTSERSSASVDDDAGFVLTDGGASFVDWGVTAGQDTVSISGGTGATPGTYNITAVTATTLTLDANGGDSGGTADVTYRIISNKPDMWGTRTADESPAGTAPARFEFSKYTDKDLSDVTPVLDHFCTADNDCRGSIDVKDD